METLYDRNGLRLYLNDKERQSFLTASTGEKRKIKAFCHVLAFTGCRLSEALQLTPRRVDFSEKTLTFRTLKQRREKPVFRSVPVPDELLDMLGDIFGLQEIQKRGNAKELDSPIFSWSRGRAWQIVKDTMKKSHIVDGPHKTAKGLRHGYGVHAVKNGVQLHMLAKWLGHAKLENTAIYAQALGEEEREIAARMWG
jgi:integrase/recombinase XerD